jgi:hypothetical protein
LRTNLFNIVLSAYFLTIGSSPFFAQESPKSAKSFSAKNQVIKENISAEKEPNKQNLIATKIDTLKVDTIKKFI